MKADVLAVMEAAAKLSFDEWTKVSDSITKAFHEKELKLHSGLKLDDTERIKYFYRIP